MREFCLWSLSVLSWEGNSLKYSQNNQHSECYQRARVCVSVDVRMGSLRQSVINDHSLYSRLRTLLQIFNRVHSSEVRAGADRWRALFLENPARLPTWVWSWGKRPPPPIPPLQNSSPHRAIRLWRRVWCLDSSTLKQPWERSVSEGRRWLDNLVQPALHVQVLRALCSSQLKW